MAGGEGKNTVHTAFTAEANLSAATRELDAFAANWNSKLKKVADATSAIDQKTFQAIKQFNAYAGAVKAFENRVTPKVRDTGGSLAGVNSGRSLRALNRLDGSDAQTVLKERKKLVKGLADHAQELRARIAEINAEMEKIGKRRGSARATGEISRLSAEVGILTKELKKLENNSYISGELTKRRTKAEDAARAAIERTTKATEAATRAEEARTRASESRGRAEANRNNREASAPARAIVTNARRGTQLEIEITRIMEQQNRLRMSGNVADKQELTLLDQALAKHRAELEILKAQAGVRERMAVNRARGARDPASPATPRRPAIQARAELMGDYVALGAITAAAYALGNYVVQYEKAMAQFQAIAAASNIETAMVSQTIEELGQNTKFTNLQIAETATLLAQAGLSATDTAGALKAIAELATAAGVELRQAGDVVTSVATVWGYDINSMAQIADILTSALNLTKLNMDQMQLGIQYAANTAADAGIGFKEMTAALGAMAQAGIRSGSTLGTGLRSLIVELETPTLKMADTLERFGLTLEDIDVRTLGLTQVLANLKTSGFGAAEAFSAFEIRSAAAFTALSANLDVMEDLQSNLGESGAAADANAVQMETLSAKWTKLTNAMMTLGSGALSPLVTLLKLLLDSLTKLFVALNEGGIVVKVLTSALVGLFATMVVGKVVAMVAGLTAMGAAATTAAVGVNVASTAVKGFGGWVGIAIGVLVLLGTAVYDLVKSLDTYAKENDRIKASVNELNSRLDANKNSIQAVTDQIEKLTKTQHLANTQAGLTQRLLDETRDRFESMGLKAVSATGGIEGMIIALQNLREELAEDYSNNLGMLADELALKARNNNERLSREGGLTTGEERGRVTRAMYPSPLAQTPQQRFGSRVNFDRLYGVARGDETYRLRTEDGKRTNAADRVLLDIAAAVKLQKELLDEALKVASADPKKAKELREWAARIAVVYSGARLQVDRANRTSEDVRQSEEYTEQARLVPIVTAATTAAETWWRTQGYERQNTEAKRDETINDAELPQALIDIADKADAATRAYLLEQERKLVDNPDAEKIMAALKELLLGRPAAFREAASTYEEIGAARQRESAADASPRTRQQNLDDDFDAAVAAMNVTQVEDALKLIEGKLKVYGLTPEAIAALLAEADVLFNKLEALKRTAAQTALNAQSFAPSVAGFGSPLVNARETSAYGMRTHPITGERKMHDGIDYAGKIGDAVLAAASGTVVANTGLGSGTGYGNQVRIRHADGLETTYSHLSRIIVKVGDVITRGQRVGDVGATGAVTGPHLHYEAFKDGKRVNPNSTRTDPRFAQLSNATNANVAAEIDADRAKFKALGVENLAESTIAGIKAEQKTVKDRMDSLLGSMENTDGDVDKLAEIMAQLNVLNARNVQLGTDLFNADADHLATANDPRTKAELAAQQVQDAIAAAEFEMKTWDAYMQARAETGQRAIDVASVALDRAQSEVGTSETAKWLAEQNVLAATYNKTVTDRAAAEAALADVLADQAVAQLALIQAKATGGDTAGLVEQINQLEIRLAKAQKDLRDAQQAQAGTRRATYQASGTSAWNQFQNIAANFGETSGVMIDTTQTITTGIEGMFTSLSTGLQQAIKDISSGALSVKDSFKRMFQGIFEELQTMAAKILANMVMKFILSKIMSFGMSSFGSSGFVAPGSGGSVVGGGFGMENVVPGMYLGGAPSGRRFALGGANPNRDSIHALLQPGEVVMRKSAVQMVGRQNLLNINAMGNSRRSEGVASHMAKPREPDMVNIWMVPANQVPPPSPKDIIHVIGSDISTGGSIKKLIRQVAQGG
jgi:TP901 family phage tail tape measure protein